MATPSTSSPIGVSDVNAEIGRGAVATDLNFLNGYLKPDGTTALVAGGTVSTPSPLRPTQPNMNVFRGGLTYYQKNTAGNCNNSNNGLANNCNVGDASKNCVACKNCGAINCANCDRQKWLQSGNCQNATTPVYNCTRETNCYQTNCNCNCNCSKIICTKLFELGMMDRKIFEADQLFGTKLIETNPDIYNGYRVWAEIVVDWMDGKGPKMLPWMSDEEWGVAMKKFSITWAYDIATPWAEEMAYMMGEKEKGSLTGKLIMAFGHPLCKAIGVWNRWFGESKKEPGFIKGAAVLAICAVVKVIIMIGKFIEYFKTEKRVI